MPDMLEVAASQSRLDTFREALAREYSVLFATSEDYAYAAARTTPFELARKMTLGLDNGTANKDGEGIKRCCAKLGIRQTYKAIRAYLTNS